MVEAFVVDDEHIAVVLVFLKHAFDFVLNVFQFLMHFRQAVVHRVCTPVSKVEIATLRMGILDGVGRWSTTERLLVRVGLHANLVFFNTVLLRKAAVSRTVACDRLHH